MDKTLAGDSQAEPSAEEVIYYKKAIAEVFSEMDRLSESMAVTQAEIERVRTETRPAMENIRRFLNETRPLS